MPPFTKEREREITDEKLVEVGDPYEICPVKSMLGRQTVNVGLATKYFY